MGVALALSIFTPKLFYPLRYIVYILLSITGIAQVLSHRLKPGEKIEITNGDETKRGGFLKYDLEVRESDTVLHPLLPPFVSISTNISYRFCLSNQWTHLADQNIGDN